MITLGPHSDIQVMGTIKFDFQKQVQNTKADVASRNASVQQAKDDYAAGNIDAAKFERQQALTAQADVRSDRAILADLHNGALQLRGDFQGRRDAISRFYQAKQAGNTQEAKQAFQAAHQLDAKVRSNLESLQSELSRSGSINETA